MSFLEPQKVILVGNRAVADVISVGRALNIHWCFYKKRHRHRHMKTDG